MDQLRQGKGAGAALHGIVERSTAAASAAAAAPPLNSDAEDAISDWDDDAAGDAPPPGKKPAKAKAAKGVKGGAKAKGEGGGKNAATLYYRITCRDNGCGMPHDKVPFMLGRVLTGSKYGLRQTRGKFGLGAKMALIWSRKSTGLPISVVTAHTPERVSSKAAAPAQVTRCVLDIDVHKNEPRVRLHTLEPNDAQMRGTELTVCIGGAWTAYRRRVVQYLQQLAVITPYAQLSLKFECPATPGRAFEYTWRRRSTQLPPPPAEVKHHPESVDQLLVRQLIHGKPDTSVANFLATQFQSISRQKAQELVEDAGVAGVATAGELNPDHVHALVRTMHQSAFPPPDGSCLSPAGEYNLRLGILKELAPEFLATHAAPVSVFEGHPFIIEAGVAIGGRTAAEGITVHRFANRIPLLFEGGGDVATRTALKRINWSSYKIDHKRDRVGVFVSMVSTKIPFKGTGKEYIGDDILPIQAAVKGALQACCKQLRVKLLLRRSAAERRNRTKNLTKYIPTVATSVMGVINDMLGGKGSSEAGSAKASAGAGAVRSSVLAEAEAGSVTVDELQSRLHTAVTASEVWAALQQATQEGGDKGASTAASDGGGASRPYFIAPLTKSEKRRGSFLQQEGTGTMLRLAPGALLEAE